MSAAHILQVCYGSREKLQQCSYCLQLPMQREFLSNCQDTCTIRFIESRLKKLPNERITGLVICQ